MKTSKPSASELERKIAEVEEIIRVLRGQEVDAIVGEESVSLVRLREVEEKFLYHESLLDSVYDPLFSADERNVIKSWNRAAERLFGWSSSEVIGKSSALLRAQFPTANGTTREQLERHLRKTGSWTGEISYLKKDGSKITVLIAYSLIRSDSGKTVGTVSTCHDISDRKKSEIALKESEEQYRRIVETSQEGIAIGSLDGNYFFLNEKMQDLLGYSREELLGKSTADFIEEECKEAERNFRVKVMDGKKAQTEFKLRRKDGSTIWTLVSACAIPNKFGRYDGYLLMFTDITHRKNTEDFLRRNAEALEHANKELEIFSYSIAHDLRAPLRSLNGFSKILLEDYGDKLDTQGKKYLERISTSAQFMSELIDGILGLSKVSKTELEKKNLDLSKIVGERAQIIAKADPRRRVSFIIAPGARDLADERLIVSVLDNLLGNAFKFTAKSQKPEIEFGFVSKENKPVYFIRDNGIGFDMRYADKLFKPFQRLHTDQTFSGTGIGLATAERIIKRHGGHIWAEAEPGKGAVFYFTLKD